MPEGSSMSDSQNRLRPVTIMSATPLNSSETTRRFRLRDLFLNQLNVIYTAEKALIEALPKLNETDTAEELKKIFGQKRIDARLIRIAEQHVNYTSSKQQNQS